MRIRYNMVGKPMVAECDLSEKKAKKRFEELKIDGLCECVELVGEEEEDYMEILDSFDKTKTARMMASILGIV